MSDLEQWLDGPLAVQRDQVPIAQDSGISQPAVEADTPFETTGESPCFAEDMLPTDLEPIRDLCNYYIGTRLGWQSTVPLP